MRTDRRLKGPAIRGHVPKVQASLQALKTTGSLISGQRNCTSGATGISPPAQPHVLLVRFLKCMLAAEMLGTDFSLPVFLPCPTVSCLCPLSREAESSCEVC